MKKISVKCSRISTDDALIIAAEGFHQSVSDRLRQDVNLHLSQGQLVYSVYEYREPVGFVIFSIFGDVLYLSGIILRSHVQARGIAQLVVSMAQEDTQLPYLALRTQSSRMWSAGRKMCRDWFPNIQMVDASDDVVRVARRITNQIGMSYPVHEGFYGGPLYGEKPMHRNHKLQSWWDTMCDFYRGDAVLCVGRF